MRGRVKGDGYVTIKPYCPGCQGPHPLTPLEDSILALLADGISYEGIHARIARPPTLKSIRNRSSVIYKSLGKDLNPDRDPRVDSVLWWQRHQARALGAVSSP